MKYCTHCGAELRDEAVLCPKCGCWVNGAVTPTLRQPTRKLNISALVGFILSMVSVVLVVIDFAGLLALAGMIVSIVGLVQIKNIKQMRGKGFAISGVIVGAIFFVFGLIYWFSMMAE